MRAFVRRRHDQLRHRLPCRLLPRAGEGSTRTRLGGLLVIWSPWLCLVHAGSGLEHPRSSDLPVSRLLVPLLSN